MTTTRRLAAILAADVAGYSRLMGADEQGTLNRLRTVRTEIVDPAIAQHRGRIVKTTGDGLLVEPPKDLPCVRCNVAPLAVNSLLRLVAAACTATGMDWHGPH